jgi:GT2 family glycosyltransferase
MDAHPLKAAAPMTTPCVSPNTASAIPVREGSVLAIVVLFRRAPTEAAAWPVLSAWLSEPPASASFSLTHVVFHDNSPEPAELPEALRSDPRLSYRHDPTNGGTRAGFLTAAELAQQLGYQWLLLLDQDTVLPAGFLEKAAIAGATDPTVAALVPRVCHGDLPVSPGVIADTGIVRPLPLHAEPPAHARLTAIASGTLLRASAFSEMGRPPAPLWLDGVDHWIFTRLHSLRQPVRVIDCTLSHDLSVVDLGAMPVWRIINMLESERLLLREWPLLARIVRPYRLFRFHQRLQQEHPNAARAMQRWLLTGKVPERPQHRAQGALSTSSIMATIDILLPVYNGGQYLQAQLDSLLSQTHTAWRCLMRDDGSKDSSLEILRHYSAAHPERFVLIEDDLGNLGTVRCLNALSTHVQAPVFAFCDQDDVWQPEKLARSLERLQALDCPAGTPGLVFCDMTVTDADLTPTADSFWDTLSARPYARNLAGLPVINVVAGCTMMGNRDLLDAAFPVPEGAPMHDYWIGMVAKYTGRIQAIEQPLMLYRQHGRNQCGVARRGPLLQRLAGRLRALDSFRAQARTSRSLRLGMLQALMSRQWPTLNVRDCRQAIDAERGGAVRRLGYLLSRGIRPDHAFIYWLA